MSRRRSWRAFGGARVRRWWGVLPKWQKALGILLVVLLLAALADGLDSGASLADTSDPTRHAVASFCRAEAAAELGLGPSSVEHAPDEQTFVKAFGAGQFRVTYWTRQAGAEQPVRFLCLALETQPGSGTFLLADLMRR